MNNNIKFNYIPKLVNLNYNDRLKMIYMWVKSDHISQAEFIELIKWIH
jgi:hypothetical protein